MTDRYQALEQLQKLREAGALTEEEFVAEKREILQPSTTVPISAGQLGRIDRRILAAAAVLGTIILGIWLGIWWRPDGTEKPMPVDNSSIEQSGDDTAQPAALSSLPEREQLRLAAIAVLGTQNPQVVTMADETKITKALRLVWLPFGPVLLTSTEIKDGCHACVGAIGVYYLAEENGAFKVKGRWPAAVSGWGWGAPPTEWSISGKFSDYPVIFASGGFTGQGITCSSSTLTELRPEGPVASDLIPTGYSNGGAVLDDGETGGGEPPREIDGKIANIVKGRSFIVIARGTENFVETYVRRNKKFVRTSGESNLGC